MEILILLEHCQWNEGSCVMNCKPRELHHFHSNLFKMLRLFSEKLVELVVMSLSFLLPRGQEIVCNIPMMTPDAEA